MFVLYCYCILYKSFFKTYPPPLPPVSVVFIILHVALVCDGDTVVVANVVCGGGVAMDVCAF
jgi:hypothetical protein